MHTNYRVLVIVFCLTMSINGQGTGNSQNNPLLAESAGVWDLTIPKRPTDRVVKLSLHRLAYGLSLIQEDNTKLQSFLAEYRRRVVPEEEQAWDIAENLVLDYTGNRALTDDLLTGSGATNHLRIIKNEDDLKKYFKLDPRGEKMTEMDWQRDPVGSCVIKRRSDLLNNRDAIEAQIRRVYADKNSAEKVIGKFQECAKQAEDTETCFNAKAADYPFLYRNYGNNSAGKNESYLKGTNRPNAMMTIYLVEGVGWKGNGWECCGNFLEFFEAVDLKAAGSATGFPATQGQGLSCEIAPQQVVLKGLGDSVTFSLNVNSQVRVAPEDMMIVWRQGNKEAARNSRELQVLGSMIPGDGKTQAIEARVAVGTKEAVCSASVSLQLPKNPDPKTPPTCSLQVAPPTLVNADDRYRVMVTLSNPDNLVVTNKTETLFPGRNPPSSYENPTGLEFSGTKADFEKYIGRVTFRHVVTGSDQTELTSCEGSLLIQEPPLERRSGICGPGGWKCWLPAIIGGGAAAAFIGRGGTAAKSGRAPADGR